MNFLRAVSCIGVALFAGALAAGQSAEKADGPDMKEIREYRLNMDVIQRFHRAFKVATTDPGAKKCLESNPPGSAGGFDAVEKAMNGCPPMAAALKTAGMKPREFMMVMFALMEVFTAVDLKKNGTIKQYPSSISPENVAFVEQNFDKLQSMLEPLTGDAK
jgi:hypothetical protein